MADDPETVAINRLHPFFWRCFLVRCISLDLIRLLPVSGADMNIVALFYSKPESGVYVTEMIIYQVAK